MEGLESVVELVTVSDERLEVDQTASDEGDREWAGSSASSKSCSAPDSLVTRTVAERAVDLDFLGQDKEHGNLNVGSTHANLYVGSSWLDEVKT